MSRIGFGRSATASRRAVNLTTAAVWLALTDARGCISFACFGRPRSVETQAANLLRSRRPTRVICLGVSAPVRVRASEPLDQLRHSLHQATFSPVWVLCDHGPCWARCRECRPTGARKAVLGRHCRQVAPVPFVASGDPGPFLGLLGAWQYPSRTPPSGDDNVGGVSACVLIAASQAFCAATGVPAGRMRPTRTTAPRRCGTKAVATAEHGDDQQPPGRDPASDDQWQGLVPTNERIPEHLTSWWRDDSVAPNSATGPQRQAAIPGTGFGRLPWRHTVGCELLPIRPTPLEVISSRRPVDRSRYHGRGVDRLAKS